jgi:hypothetical protein
VLQFGKMNYRYFFTEYLRLIFLNFFLTFALYGQSSVNYPYLSPFFYPNYENIYNDTCLYFPELIFTVGGVQPSKRYAQIEIKKQDKKINNGKKLERLYENDTTSTKGNRIVSIQETERGDKMAVYLEIENPEQKIKIIVYNLLGKKVLDIYEGKPKDPSQPYEFSVAELPKGIFLLVVVGDNFRLREKLVVTK